VSSTFNFLSNAIKGSFLIFTYVIRDFIEGKNLYGWEKGYNNFVLKKTWKFGKNPEEWNDYLSKFGWQIIEDKNYSDLTQIFSVRKLNTTKIERIIFAQKL